jgi:hypothetical protein
MKYKALITLDLHNVDDSQRLTFYKVLEEVYWTKIVALTTTWKCSFKEDVSYADALNMLKSDINKAKLEAKVTKVQYAIQLGANEVCLG